MSTTEDRQQLASALSVRLLTTCAEFCDENFVKHRGHDENIVCVVATQLALMGLLTKTKHAPIVRATLAETLVDGTAETLLQHLSNVNKGVRDERH